MTFDVTLEWTDGRHLGVWSEGEADTTVVLAPGAGTDAQHPAVTGLRDALVREGLRVVTFDYPYRAEGRKAPDRAPILQAAHRTVLAWVRSELTDLPVAAGRSMGGRISSMLAADGEKLAGVVCYAYPLHPAGKPDRLRIEHLDRVPVPMLFFQGGRDRLSQPELFDRHVRPLPTATVIDLPGADHSFRIKGVDPEEVWKGLARDTALWIEGVLQPA